MSMKSDPKYDTDLVNLGYLKKIINELKEINSTTQNNLEKVFSKNYGSQPTTPYYSGSTWTTEDYIYRCIKDRLIGPFSIDDWVIIYDRKKEKLMNENFLFLSQVELKEQSDGYIETYYLVDDPSASWDTSLLKSTHEGDFWRTKTETGFCDYVYTKLATNPVSYDWLITNLPITVFNAVTGTKKIYLVEPNNYSEGDLWQKIENNNKVYYEALKDSDTFNAEDWEIINEELSLKNLESYYLITSEINKELENIDKKVTKKIAESSDSILLSIESEYTSKETTKLLTEKVDANGESIEQIYGDRTIEIPIKTLSELTLGQEQIQTTVGEVSVKTSDLEKSIEYFAVELEMYNFNVPTDSEGYVLENSAYTIKHYAYYKGQQVEVTPVLKNNINGFNIVVTSSNIQIDTTKGTKIDELNNILEFSFIYKDGDQENILIKKVSVSLALQGKTGATGQDGKDGAGVNILGSFETFEELQQVHPAGTMGDAYLIKGNLYVWSGSSWENVGNIQGPKGDKGDQGEQGLRGLQGPQGEQGIAGKDGTDGKTTYFHIKYSDVEIPTNSSQLLELPGDYIGTYIDFEKEDSNNPQDYTWSRFKGIQGETGEQGIPGQNGENGLTSYLHIKYSNDGLTFTENNGETSGDYIGQYTDFQKDDSSDFDSYKWTKIKGQIGPQGPQGEQGEKGDTGAQGPQGIPGVAGKNGTSTYFYIKYSENSSGDPMYDAPTDKTMYMGVASTTSDTAPISYSAYTWFKTQGETGPQGIPGQTGSDGQTSYLHIKYSNDGLNFTANNGEEIGRWQGTYVDFQETDSLEFSDYKWVDTAIVVNEQINDLNDKIDDTNINLKENYTNNKDLEQKIEDAKTTVITEMQTVITQTKESWEANVIKKINADGVETVKNSLVVIDIKGITVATNISKVSTIMTNNTFAIQNNAGTYLAFFGYDEQEGKSKAEMDNLTIKNYLTTGYHRTEGFVTEEGEKRTGVFYIGG